MFGRHGQLITVGGDPIKGQIEVGVDDQNLAKARAEIPRRYPTLPIAIVAQQPITW